MVFRFDRNALFELALIEDYFCQILCSRRSIIGDILSLLFVLQKVAEICKYFEGFLVW